MESFPDRIPSFVPVSCFTASCLDVTVKHVPFADMFRFVLNTFDDDDALQGKYGRHLWNPIINKGSEVKDQRLQQSGVVQCSTADQLLIYNLLRDAERLIYDMRLVELDVRIGCLLALCDLNKSGLHSLRVPVKVGRLLLSGRNVVVKLSTNTLSMKNAG